MINAHMDKNSAVPWWAAFGAPLVGVPLLVVLLALGAPKKAQANESDAKAYATTEQVHSTVLETAVQLPPASKEDAAAPRC